MSVLTLLTSCLPPFLLAAGLFFFVRLSGFPFSRPRILFSLLGEGGASSRRALVLSLAGTLGVGNIAGVGVALAIGGEGAILWLFVGGIVATVLKYAEIALSVDKRRPGEKSRGALDYIRPTLGSGAALLFALLMLALSILMGSLLQGSVIRAAADGLRACPPLPLALCLSGMTALLFLGGRRAVERLTGALIPVLTVLYCALAVGILLKNFAALPYVTLRIVRGAFSFRSVGGGLLGTGIVRAMRAGIGKGLFSNEAGAGTAPFAHGDAGVHPAHEGLYGVLEVAIDTLFMCTLTALAVLSCFRELPALSGTALVSAAFSAVYGRAAGAAVALSVILFSYATVACWVSYGRAVLSLLSPARPLRFIYAASFCLALTLGVYLGEKSTFLLCDAALAAMTFINTAALLKNAPRIRHLTDEYLLLQKARARKRKGARSEAREFQTKAPSLTRRAHGKR